MLSDVKAISLRENHDLQNQVVQRLNQGKIVVIKFENEKDKLDFIKHSQTLLTLGGAVGGIVAGLAVGGMLGPAGAAIGAGIGGIMGACSGYSLGTWLANFLWNNVLKNGNFKYKDACSWFGLAPHRMIVQAT